MYSSLCIILLLYIRSATGKSANYVQRIHYMYIEALCFVRYTCCISCGDQVPNLKNSNFLYLHSKIHSNITENMPRNLTLHPPLPGKLKYLFHPPLEKKISGSPHDLPSPFLHKLHFP